MTFTDFIMIIGAFWVPFVVLYFSSFKERIPDKDWVSALARQLNRAASRRDDAIFKSLESTKRAFLTISKEIDSDKVRSKIKEFSDNLEDTNTKMREIDDEFGNALDNDLKKAV